MDASELNENNVALYLYEIEFNPYGCKDYTLLWHIHYNYWNTKKTHKENHDEWIEYHKFHLLFYIEKYKEQCRKAST